MKEALTYSVAAPAVAYRRSMAGRPVSRPSIVRTIAGYGDDLLCTLSDGRTLAASWRQIWTYRRTRHNDDFRAIAQQALEEAPEIFGAVTIPSWQRKRMSRSSESISFSEWLRKAFWH